jgi:redox-sensitive bicupin YhaK (pirin superfamily)
MPVIAPLQRANHGSHFRAYGLRGMAALIDPFIGVDHAWMSAPTFPLHPHSGFSAASYLFLDSETGINNRDSIGSKNLIQPGGLHWTTAGKGVLHEEVPAETGKTVHSLQVFVNLAPDQRNIMPFALTLEPQNVPVLQLPGINVRVPVGNFRNASSPLNPPTKVTILDLSLEGGAMLAIPVPVGHCAFVMSISGRVMVDGQSFDHNNLILPVFPAQNEPRVITLQAPHDSAKVMFFAGQPLHPCVI